MNPRTREKEKDRPSCFNSPGILQFPAARKNSGAKTKRERGEEWVSKGLVGTVAARVSPLRSETKGNDDRET